MARPPVPRGVVCDPGVEGRAVLVPFSSAPSAVDLTALSLDGDGAESRLVDQRGGLAGLQDAGQRLPLGVDHFPRPAALVVAFHVPPTSRATLQGA